MIRAHDLVDRQTAVLQGGFGKSGIQGGGLRIGMAKEFLNMPEMDIVLYEMNGKAVTQGMNADALFDTAIFEGPLEGLLCPFPIHRGVGFSDVFGRSVLVGENQLRITMGFPESPQSQQGYFGKIDKTILLSFPLTNVDFHVLAVNIRNSQVECFTETQAHAVDGEQVDFVTQFFDRTDDFLKLLSGQKIRKALNSRGFYDIDPVPFFVKNMFPEELKSAAVDLYGAPGVGFEEIGEIGLQFAGSQAIGATLEILKRPPDGSAVKVNGAGAFPLKGESLLMLGIEAVKLVLFLGFHEKLLVKNFPAKIP